MGSIHNDSKAGFPGGTGLVRMLQHDFGGGNSGSSLLWWYPGGTGQIRCTLSEGPCASHAGPGSAATTNGAQQ